MGRGLAEVGGASCQVGAGPGCSSGPSQTRPHTHHCHPDLVLPKAAPQRCRKVSSSESQRTKQPVQQGSCAEGGSGTRPLQGCVQREPSGRTCMQTDVGSGRVQKLVPARASIGAPWGKPWSNPSTVLIGWCPRLMALSLALIGRCSQTMPPNQHLSLIG